jgi:amidase
MHPDEFRSFDLCGLVDLVTRGECSAPEIYRAAYEALLHADRQYACMVELCGCPADKTFEALAHTNFRGLPLALKDAGAHQANALQESGSRLFEGLPAAGETHVARRIRDAGLRVIGRTTTAELTYGFSAEPSWGRATVNPWREDRTSGGSSAGSAAAVACGALPVAHGTDGGGSLRVPAAWCGLVALKPSRGRISWGPGLSEVLFGMATEGVLTRSVRDSAVMLDVLAGEEAGDPFAISPPDESYAASHLHKQDPLRIGVFKERIAGGVPIAEDVLSVLDHTAQTLDTFGHKVLRSALSLGEEQLLAAITDVWCSQLSLMVTAVVSATQRDPGAMLDPAINTCFTHGLTVSAAQLWQAQLHFNAVSRDIGALLTDLDLLLMPTANVTAPALGVLSPAGKVSDARDWTRHIFSVASFTAPFNIAGLPAISLPLGLDREGMPVGVQVVARHGREDQLLRIARQFECGGYFLPPMWEQQSHR